MKAASYETRLIITKTAWLRRESLALLVKDAAETRNTSLFHYPFTLRQKVETELIMSFPEGYLVGSAAECKKILRKIVVFKWRNDTRYGGLHGKWNFLEDFVLSLFVCNCKNHSLD